MVPLNLTFIRNLEGGSRDTLAGLVDNELRLIVCARIPRADKDHRLGGGAAEAELHRVLRVCQVRV